MRTLFVALMLTAVALTAVATASPAAAKPCQELNGPDDFSCRLLSYQDCEVAASNHIAPGGHDYGGPKIVVDAGCLYP